MELIKASFAKKIKPLVAEAMDVISKIMENPDEFISVGYWTIPNDFEFSENCNDIYDDLTVGEYQIFYDWIRQWLKANGWEFAYPVDWPLHFKGSRIFPLHYEDSTTN